MSYSELMRSLDRLEQGVGRRYPPDVRRQVVAWVACERAAGRCWGALSDELGIPVSTLVRWSSRPRALPVVVETPRSPSASMVSMVSPSGWRIEGVTLEQALALLGER